MGILMGVSMGVLMGVLMGILMGIRSSPGVAGHPPVTLGNPQNGMCFPTSATPLPSRQSPPSPNSHHRQLIVYRRIGRLPTSLASSASSCVITICMSEQHIPPQQLIVACAGSSCMGRVPDDLLWSKRFAPTLHFTLCCAAKKVAQYVIPNKRLLILANIANRGKKLKRSAPLGWRSPSTVIPLFKTTYSAPSPIIKRPPNEIVTCPIPVTSPLRRVGHILHLANNPPHSTIERTSAAPWSNIAPSTLPLGMIPAASATWTPWR
ncbi:uncharacterized protein K489DRAFT_164850 [Dissoconium aciculare CBS 342.82]|uniref:Uncharacterized protein n=1 Tax=Dissoconium aciculare CBS 342.82 TaxID=1314786 RepID=A0A6J3MFM2_9PEZI|nr:uncharacterized protein K489DRAFT_164850 [Dissoconium aciculare CBS 342.82]KAF1825677.1 hypothetical protein K489DRAFT_164850 [Dissoconium aciculare CBS 342.82]